MTNLGDYLGHLLSEVTIARMQADIEAVRIGELYASHPLLRHWPVPRFRLPEVEFDVPVLIDEVADAPSGGSPRGGADPDELRRVYDDVLTGFLARERIATDGSELERLRNALDAASASALSRPAELTVDVLGLADELTRTTFAELGPLQPTGPIASDRLASLKSDLRDSARLALLRARRPPPRVGVVATTARIRDARPGEVVTRLRFKINEEGVEWASTGDEGDGPERLVPE